QPRVVRAAARGRHHLPARPAARPARRGGRRAALGRARRGPARHAHHGRAARRLGGAGAARVDGRGRRTGRPHRPPRLALPLGPAPDGPAAPSDELAAGGVAAPTREAPVLIGFAGAGRRRGPAPRAGRGAGGGSRRSGRPPSARWGHRSRSGSGTCSASTAGAASTPAGTPPRSPTPSGPGGGRLVAGAHVRAVRRGPGGLQVQTPTHAPVPRDAAVPA